MTLPSCSRPLRSDVSPCADELPRPQSVLARPPFPASVESQVQTVAVDHSAPAARIVPLRIGV